MRVKQLTWLAVAFAALILCLAGVAMAQSVVTGAITGTVTDPSGAVVAGAHVTLKDLANGQNSPTQTNTSGVFEFSLLRPGEYTITVEHAGFKTSSVRANALLGTTTPVNVRLELGAGNVTVEVTAQGSLLQTETSNISTNFETQQINNIPNPGGDVTYIAQTAPGVTMNNSTAGGFGNFSAFGLPGTANLFTYNGNDYNDAFLNLNNSGSSNLLLGGNELQEVAVVSNGYTGQYGRQAGAQIDYTTKAGTNGFHGDAVYYWTGRYLNANDPINKAFGGTRPFENNNQWAANFGGPIKKDKLFFFVNTEGIRYIFGSVHNVTVPSPDFQTFVNNNMLAQSAATQAFYKNAFKLYNNAPGIQNAILNTSAGGNTKGTPIGSCAGYVVNPKTLLIDDPVTGVALPAALQTGGCTESFTQSVPNGNKEYLISGRVDYSFSDKDKFFARVKFDRGTQPTYTDSINSVFDDFSVQPQNEGQGNYTHIFSPNVVNNLILSSLWYSAIFGQTSPGAALALFPGNIAFTVDGSMTALGTGSGNPGGFAQGFLYPQGRRVEQYQIVDDLSVTMGVHAFKMGINFRRDLITDLTAAEQTIYPAINLSLYGFANNAVAPAVNPGSVQYNFTSTPTQPVRYYSFGLYFQDEYRATSKLKITMTLRADRNSGGTCAANCASLPISPFNNLPHGAGIPYNAADGGSFATGLKTIIPSNELVVFQPRFGVAWTPWGQNTVIRAGVGLFTDLYPGTILSGFDTNFPQVNLWNVPIGSIAFDLNPPGTTAFPTSGVAAVQTCNAGFTNNFNIGGNLTSYQKALPQCVNTLGAQTVPTLNDVVRNLKNPKYVEWNFEIQHQIFPHTVVSANYVGNRGFDELIFNDDLNGFGFGPLPAAAPDPRVARVNFLQNGGKSNYNGLILSVQEGSWHGLSGRFNYTYSKALDTMSNGGVLPFSVITSIGTQINPFNINSGYGLADYNAKHQISGSYVYALPFKSSNRWMNYAIGGWQLSGTLFYRTGFPFSFIDGGQTNALAGNNLSGSTILLQPAFAERNFGDAQPCILTPCWGLGKGAPLGFVQPSTGFVNPAVGRNAFIGPGFLGGDMSLRKDFKVTERIDFQVGLNVYNWLNHANYGVPYPNTNAPFFGSTIATETPPTSPYGAFAAAATDMRMAQLQAKLVF